MTLDQPVVGRKAGIGVVEAEVVMADANGPIAHNADGGLEGLAAQRRDTEGSLVYSDGVGPGQSTVSGRREGNIVVLKVAETGVFPDGVEVSAADVLGERRVTGVVQVQACLWVNNAVEAIGLEDRR